VARGKLRVLRVSARNCPQIFCGFLLGRRVICEGSGHRCFDEAKNVKLS